MIFTPSKEVQFEESAVKIEESQFTIENIINKAISKSMSKALQTYYPANNGALGAVKRKFLMTEDKIDGSGKLGGKYFSPVGTPMEMRALPPDADLSQYRVFEVVKPFEVEASMIPPAFNKLGFEIQFRSPVSAEILLERKIIKIIQ